MKDSLNSNRLTSFNDEPKKKRTWQVFKIAVRVALCIYKMLVLLFEGDP